MCLNDCWCVPLPSTLHWEGWGEQVALYDERSGETHLLNKLTAAGLQELCTRAMNSTELCKFLADRFETQCNEHFMKQIEALLVQFEQLGLVENVRPKAE